MTSLASLLPFAELRKLCSTVFKFSRSVCNFECINQYRRVEEDGEGQVEEGREESEVKEKDGME